MLLNILNMFGCVRHILYVFSVCLYAHLMYFFIFFDFTRAFFTYFPFTPIGSGRELHIFTPPTPRPYSELPCPVSQFRSVSRGRHGRSPYYLTECKGSYIPLNSKGSKHGARLKAIGVRGHGVGDYVFVCACLMYF